MHHKIFIISVCFSFENFANLHWKLMIDQKFDVVYQISQLAKIPQNWFSTQNGPLDVRSQIEASDFWRNQAKTMAQYF